MRILVLAATLALGACASLPPPTQGMDQARNGLQAAIAVDGPMYAPLEIGFAKAKLQQAETAMQQEEYADAAQLAQESEANSALAQVKGQLGQLRKQIKQTTAENTRLRQQLLGADAVPAAAASTGDQP
ncbi:MAG: DUF4398 domain-containing protein [Xanthomonadales bacterium]|nr:DUF4398 domain-containing protein [Xanthomonadales bacterium]